jgi:hypothetical protein
VLVLNINEIIIIMVTTDAILFPSLSFSLSCPRDKRSSSSSNVVLHLVYAQFFRIQQPDLIRPPFLFALQK